MTEQEQAQEQAQESKSGALRQTSKALASVYLTGLAYSRIGDARFAASHGVRYKGLPLGFRQLMGGSKDPTKMTISSGNAVGLGLVGMAFGGPVGAIAGATVGALWKEGILDIMKPGNRHRSVKIAHGIDSTVDASSRMYYHPTEYTLGPIQHRFNTTMSKHNAKISEAYTADPYRIVQERVPVFKETRKKVTEDGKTLSFSDTRTPTGSLAPIRSNRMVEAMLDAGPSWVKHPSRAVGHASFMKSLIGAIDRRENIPFKYKYYQQYLAQAARQYDSLSISDIIRHNNALTDVTSKAYREILASHAYGDVAAKELGRFAVWRTMDQFRSSKLLPGSGRFRFAFGFTKNSLLNKTRKAVAEEVRQDALLRYGGFDEIIAGKTPPAQSSLGVQSLRRRSQERAEIMEKRNERLYKRDAAKLQQAQAAQPSPASVASGTAGRTRHERERNAQRQKSSANRAARQNRETIQQKAFFRVERQELEERITALQTLAKQSKKSLDVSGLVAELKNINDVVREGAASAEFVESSIKTLGNKIAQTATTHNVNVASAAERLVGAEVGRVNALAQVSRVQYLSKFGAGLLGVSTLFDIGAAAFTGMYKLGQSVSIGSAKMRALEFGSGIAIQTQQSTSERERALQMISTNRMNASSFLGNEAQQFAR